ncbi:hypothetical protein OGAPHI_005458 [Ogataea philodendri]|uniref:Uncharacterized protein n=1 Tax=Ogataea philodendri TaxID=1378263 RepID=A0A9P8T1R6_9ASCO|nr:uncharacterized protein OGAPHI_005458 [Ogataea philodendri]KAH3662210.1 hypothetical protein OGAPHI_005458 [Ogataea philodendri]
MRLRLEDELSRPFALYLDAKESAGESAGEFSFFLFFRNSRTSLFSGGSPGKVPHEVFVVVADDLGDDITGADSFGSLGGQKHACLLHRLVDVVDPLCFVRKIIVRTEIDLVFSQKINRQDPRCVLDHLIHPLAVSQRLVPLLVA